MWRLVRNGLTPPLAGAISKMQETEQLVLAPARGEGFDFEAFEAAWTAFEKARV